MKRYYLMIFLLLIIHQSNAQNDIIGKYHDFFSSKLILNSDSSYTYSYHFDLSSSWSVGTWKLIRDTLILANTPIYDTLIYADTISSMDGTIDIQEKTELVLSMNDIPERITTNTAALTALSGGGQNRYLPPLKLFYKKGYLYKIDERGMLLTKRIYCSFRQKKYKPYYINE